jgi:HEAT repeat protein
MLDSVFEEPRPPREAPPPPARRRRFGGPAVLVPALLAILFGSIVYFFGFLSSDRRSPADLVREMRNAAPERRLPAAFELSRMVAYDLDPAERHETAGQVAELLRETPPSEPDVRRALALTLGRLGDPSGVSALVEAAEDGDVETRILTIWSLGAIGDPRGVEPVVARLADSDAGVRKVAAYALGLLGDPRALPVLRVRLQDPVEDVRWNAALALSRMGDPAGLPVLLPLLEEPHPLPGGSDPRREEELRINVVRSLRNVREDAAREALIRAARSDPSPRIRSEAMRALEGLTAPFPSSPQPP